MSKNPNPSKNRNSSQKVKQSKQKHGLSKNKINKEPKIAKVSDDSLAKNSIKEDIIVLSHLQNRIYSKSDMYLPSQYKLDEESEKRMKHNQKLRKKGAKVIHFEPNYIIDENIEKDNIIKTELFIKNSLDNYYKIEKDKNDELQKIFGQSKLKVQLKNINIISDDKIFILEHIQETVQSPQLKDAGINNNIINNNNLYNFNNNFDFNNINNNNFYNFNNNFGGPQNTKQKIKIYDNNNFKLLNEIELPKGFWSNDLFQRVNLICSPETKLSAVELDNKDLIISSYYDNLIINIYRYENNNYSLIQKIGDINNQGLRNAFPPISNKTIQKLSGDRFVTITNDKMQIYSLNKNNMYEVILSHNCQYIKDIYEIDINNFIVCTLRKIFKNNNQNYSNLNVYNINYNNIYEIKKITFDNEKPSSKELFQEKKEIEHIPSDYIILKKKFFVIYIKENLCVFSISDGKILKKYKFLENGEKNANLYKINYIGIYKWNCSDDDEFIINLGGNITLFKIEEEKNEIIILKIIAYSYFKDIQGYALKKMKEDNKFLVEYMDYALIY